MEFGPDQQMMMTLINKRKPGQSEQEYGLELGSAFSTAIGTQSEIQEVAIVYILLPLFAQSAKRLIDIKCEDDVAWFLNNATDLFRALLEAERQKVMAKGKKK